MDIYDQGKLGYEESTTSGLALHVLGSAILSSTFSPAVNRMCTASRADASLTR